MSVKRAKYNVYNGTNFDEIRFTTEAELVEIKDTNNKFNATNVEGALEENADKLESHLAENMPHQFINHKENKTYKFGFQVSVDGKPQIIYEEVV